MKPNFQKLVSEILDSGWTQTEIASRLCRAQSWVSDIYRGEQTDLKFADAHALIALHKEISKSKEAA